MHSVEHIEDGFGRRFPYLRLSVTDTCNFSCTYCLPDGYIKAHAEKYLSIPETVRLVGAFAELGTWKVRLTGGEPTIRPDFIDLACAVSGVTGIRNVSVTTNGYKLPERAKSFFDAGIKNINISIDSLDPRRFHEITGHDRLSEVIEGVEACFDIGFENTKINAVLLKGLNDGELDGFLDFIRGRDLSLRFIELMQTGDNLAYFRKYHVPATVIRERLSARGWLAMPRAEGSGPAIEYSHSDYQGRIGIIAPYAKDFCMTCNRLRVSSRGDLHLCLFGEGGYALRHLLQDDDMKEELKETILRLMQFKKSTHFLHDGNTGARPHLASIGG